MKKLSIALRHHKKLKGVFEKTTDTRVLEQSWEKIFGALAQDIWFGYLKNGVLFVYSKNPAWINEIDVYKSVVLEKIKRIVGLTISDIVVSVKKKTRSEKPIISTTQVFSQVPQEKKRLEDKKKQRLGYELCEECGIVRGRTKRCVFCRNRQSTNP